MNNRFLMLALAGLLAACSTGGGGDNPLQSDEECVRENPLQECEEEGSDGGGDGSTDEGIPETLSQNLTAFSFAEDGDSISLTMLGIDGTPVSTVYAYTPALNVLDGDGDIAYRAYVQQEDALDRMFVALGAESADGSTRAVAVSDGGQFNRVLQGAGYERDGAYDPPSIGTGPGAGQVSYAGYYGGMTTIGSANGAQLIDVPEGSETPDLPGQTAQVTGRIFLNANFSDNQVNGEIYMRNLINPDDGSIAMALSDITLVITDIDENGEFFGDVEETGVAETDIGDYGGIFGGTDAASVAGAAAFTWSNDSYSQVDEIGVFVLTQCGMDGDQADICSLVSPSN